MSVQSIRLEISPRKLLQILLAMIASLSVLGVVDHYVHYVLGHEYVFGLLRLFDLDEEVNIPTYFQSCQHLLIAMTVFLIARQKMVSKDRFARHWMGIVFLFGYAALDEACSIHEILNYPLKQFFGFDGFLYFSWIAAGIFVILVLFLTYVRFVWSLPRKTRNGFILSAFIFILGAVVVESIGGYLESRGLRPSFIYALCADLEETFEMLGLFWFTKTLLEYISALGYNEILFCFKKDA